MKPDHLPDPAERLSIALGHMKEALRLLDEAGAPGDIGSYLDLAVARLESRLGSGERAGEIALILTDPIEPCR